MRFDGINVLVTGGSSGIGLECARAFLREGATVTLAARSEERLREARAALIDEEDAGGRVRTAVCDVQDEAAVADAVATADGGTGLTAVVASAGVGWVAPIATIEREDWQRVVDTNLTGTFLTLKHAAPRMATAGGGAFTAISSVSGILSTRFHAAYSSAKAGVDMLARAAADELAPAGIRVNAVRPGFVETPLSRGVLSDGGFRGQVIGEMPLGRLGDVGDVAAAVCFLSSQDASWITGVCLDVDGGHHLRRGPRFDAWVRGQHDDAPAWWGIDR